MEQILKINVLCTDSYEVKTEEKTVNQVLFEGTAEGKYFTGRILPGGVDTQVYEKDAGRLSARYMLEGTDSENNKCRIFVENNAASGDEFTHPRLYTDSKALKWLNHAELKGRILNENDKLVIEILR